MKLRARAVSCVSIGVASFCGREKGRRACPGGAGTMTGAAAVDEHQDAASASGAATDPVCGMAVDPATTAHATTHGGVHHYFCSAGCLAKFEADPDRYAQKAEPVAAQAPEGASWTCPMHPEIQRPGPGSCPICGMALEPVMPAASDGPSEEYRDMRRRFGIGLLLALPVLALEMGGHMTGLHQFVGRQTNNWVQMLLATPVVLWAGWPFFERAWLSIRNKSLNMFTLIAMGTGVAWSYSMIAALVPQIFPAASK